MLRCSKEAFARRPTAHLCGQREDCTFVEGSECDKFNQAVECGRGPQTNADFIRELFSTDEGMAKTLRGLDIMLAEDGKEFTALYCDGKNNCADGDGEIICNEEMQTACILHWLRRPVRQSNAADYEYKQYSGLVEEY